MVVFNITSVLFVVGVTIYMSNPATSQWLGIVSVVLYFLCWLMAASAFCFVMPGLCKNDYYPTFRILLAICYTLFGFAYPLILIVAVVQSNKDKPAKKNTNTPELDEMFDSQSAMVVNLPIIIMAGLHFVMVAP